MNPQRHYCMIKQCPCPFSEPDDAPRIYEMAFTCDTYAGHQTVRESLPNAFRCMITGKQTAEMDDCPITSKLKWEQVRHLLVK